MNSLRSRGFHQIEEIFMFFEDVVEFRLALCAALDAAT
jgi:hypothetical protein